ncbi:hypothetical protein [Herbaspirillum rhizosphaerae]|uniref:hypothetical protein n=1 Tax=Herbaspirillum rhizosphaerae TaxID=346179 RepID=UPI0009F8574C|nr:hypothetical protein [Herbaspirillum rhizosphaerae]
MQRTQLLVAAKAVAMALVFLVGALAGRRADAATGYYLVSVYSAENEISVDYKYWNAKRNGAAPLGSPEIGIGYGVTSRWYTEVYGTYTQTAAQGTQFSSLNWQNDVLLTQGQYWFDLAIHTNIEQYTRRDGYGLEWGPVFQTEVWRTQLNANVFLQRDYRTAGSNNATQLVYQWQVRQHWKPLLNFGLQGFGELGRWDNWNSTATQSHRAGPALFGTWHLENGHKLLYETAYLIGKNSGRSAKSFTMRVQYAF